MTTIKDVTEQKERKKKPKSLIGFLSANKINMYNRVGEGEKKKKKSKTIYRTSQKIRIANVFLESLLSHSPPHLPRMPSNTVLISGPALGSELHTVPIISRKDWKKSKDTASKEISQDSRCFTHLRNFPYGTRRTPKWWPR